MTTAVVGWQQRAREQAQEQFRLAWERAPASGREAFLEAVRRERVGHRWSTGAGACVLALLVRPALRPAESPKAVAYRMFGCEVTDDFPATWDAAGVTLTELLAAVGVRLPETPKRGLLGRLLPA
ncbi:MAG: hypothetical protein ACRDJE_19765 [Dehalococcoidia bacterium]